MRATAPAMKAVDVWDVLLTSIITPASIGELLDDYPQLTNFEYEADLADGANYVPPAGIQFSFGIETKLGTANMVLQWYDPVNTTWTNAQDAVEDATTLFQTASQRYRLLCDSGSIPKSFGVYGWSL